MKRLKLILIGLLILACMMLIGCNSSNQGNKTGVQIYSMITSLGAVDNYDTDHQKLSYSVTITNEENRDIFVKSIKPILADGISDKVITEDLTVIVESVCCKIKVPKVAS